MKPEMEPGLLKGDRNEDIAEGFICRATEFRIYPAGNRYP